MWIEREAGHTLAYKIRPGATPDAPAALLVHGRAGSRRSMLAFVRSFGSDCTLLLPEAPYDDEIGGKSWWLIESPAIESEAIKSAETLDAWYRSVCTEHGFAPRSLHAFGFSQGGALLSLLAQERVLPMDSLCLLASFVLRSRTALPGGHYPQTLMLNGRDDETIPVEAAQTGMEHLRQLGFPIELFIDDVGHRISVSGMKRLREWISSHGMAKGWPSDSAV